MDVTKNNLILTLFSGPLPSSKYIRGAIIRTVLHLSNAFDSFDVLEKHNNNINDNNIFGYPYITMVLHPIIKT